MGVNTVSLFSPTEDVSPSRRGTSILTHGIHLLCTLTGGNWPK